MKKPFAAATSLAEEAKTLGNHKSRKAAIVAAVTEYVQWRKQREIIELFGTIEYEPSYDHKRDRNLKRT